MDAQPNCAICSAPPHSECLCESERLQIAVDQAENRAMDEKQVLIRYFFQQHSSERQTYRFAVTG